LIRSNVSEIFGEINFKSSACRARGKASSAAHSVINKVSGPEGTLLQVICLTANSRRPPLARLAFPTFGWKTRLTLRASRPHASQAVGLLHVLYSGVCWKKSELIFGRTPTDCRPSGGNPAQRLAA